MSKGQKVRAVDFVLIERRVTRSCVSVHAYVCVWGGEGEEGGCGERKNRCRAPAVTPQQQQTAFSLVEHSGIFFF